MHVRIRKLGTLQQEDDLFVSISKTDYIEKLKKIVQELTDVKIHQIMLIYKGKEVSS